MAEPFPATPSLLYRSAFAEECEALAAAVREAGQRLPSTVEDERLTPLSPGSSSWASFSSSFSFQKRSPNRTYDGGPPSSPRLDLTFEWEPPQPPPPTLGPVTSTPAPPWPENPNKTTTRTTEGEGEGEAASARGKRPSGKEGGLPTSKKRRLSVAGNGPKGAPDPKAQKPAPRSSSNWAAPGPSRPLAQKQLPDETRNSLTEVLHERKSGVSVQPPSQRNKKPALGGSLACQGLKHQRENKPPGTKLPVPTAAGGPKTGKMHPKEKEPATGSAKKQITAKRVSQGIGLKWKHSGGSLLTARQVPRAAPGCGPCLQCQGLLQENQRLAEENQHLKTLLENCQCRDGASQTVKCVVEVTSKV